MTFCCFFVESTFINPFCLGACCRLGLQTGFEPWAWYKLLFGRTSSTIWSLLADFLRATRPVSGQLQVLLMEGLLQVRCVQEEGEDEVVRSVLAIGAVGLHMLAPLGHLGTSSKDIEPAEL